MATDDFFPTLARGMLEKTMDNLEKSVEVYYTAFKEGEPSLDRKKAFAYAYVFGYMENIFEDLTEKYSVNNINREDIANELIKNEKYKKRVGDILDKITDL